ncbi:DNA polymerase III subunit gamma/tau [Candidatus Parcubacteria bacterium]|nr:DNA polymerase III subunit gamma/tau [Candidatus Parcubacteria bacterium]
MTKSSSEKDDAQGNGVQEVALYRKYRPQKFADVIGQEHIVNVLEGSIKQGNISHAYLFAGSRGTGKTSIARIFAKEIGTSANDLYEIDAASNRGIDDVREIRESVQTLPFESKYKVYIVDEVHMLTKEAFNALLKTLEEPPSYVVFILATTEIEKLPETVVSRCQTFTFKKPSQPMLKNDVVDVAKKEGFELDASSADLIALLGDGSFRDTLGILQKVISSVDVTTGAPTGARATHTAQKITLAEVEAITGAPRATLINEIIEAVAHKDKEKALTAVQTAVSGNVDMTVFMKMLLEKMRFVLLLRFAPVMEKQISSQVSQEDFAWLKKLSGEKDINISSSVLLEMLTAYENTSRAYIAHLPLEIAIISVC